MSKITKCGVIMSLFFSIALVMGFYADAHAAAAVPKKNDSDSSQGTDVVLVVDNSRSIWSRQETRNAAMKAAVNVIVGSDIRVGCVYFAGEVYSKYSLSSVKTEEEYSCTCMEYLDMTDKNENNIDTNIGKGLEGALTLFESDSNKKKIVILLSDGINENASGDEQYREKANALTKKMAEKLYDEHIELHCISINGRNDESFLKQLVNYFIDSDKYDDRYIPVEPNHINELYDEFTKKFYSFRGDIKYHMASLDSNGSCTFSVPEMAVTRLQIYIRGKNITPLLECTSAEAEVKEWTLDQSTFLTVDSPPKGDWILNVLSPKKQDIDDAKVLIAYYTDLAALAFIEPLDGEELFKGHDARLKLQFFNGKNELIDIDSEAVVTAEMNTVGNDGIKSSLELSADNHEDSCLFSDNFRIKDFGKISVDIKVRYGKNIDMDYSFGIVASVVSHAPRIIKHYNNNAIIAEKTNDKYLFKIPLDEYVSDPDSPLSELRISDVHRYSDENIFTARLENERIVIEAENYGTISGTIELKDNDDKTVKLEVEGSIQDMKPTNIFIAFLGFAVLAIVVVVLVIIVRKFQKSEKDANTQKNLQDTREKLQNRKADIEKQKLDEYPSTCLNDYNIIKNSWDNFCKNSNVTGNVKKCIDNILFPGINLFDDIKSRIELLNKKIHIHNGKLNEKIQALTEQERKLSPETLKGCLNEHINECINAANAVIDESKENIPSKTDINTAGIDEDIKKLKNLAEIIKIKKDSYENHGVIPCKIRIFQGNQRYLVEKPKNNSGKWLIGFDDLVSSNRRTAREISGESNIYFMSDRQEISVKNKAGVEEKKMVSVVHVIHIEESEPGYENKTMQIGDKQDLYGLTIELEEVQ